MHSEQLDAANRIVDTDPVAAFRLTLDGIRALADSPSSDPRMADRYWAPRPADVEALIDLAESLGHRLDRIFAHADDDHVERR